MLRRLRHSPAVRRTLLALALVGATWPAWREWVVDMPPDYEALLQQRCTSVPDVALTIPWMTAFRGVPASAPAAREWPIRVNP